MKNAASSAFRASSAAVLLSLSTLAFAAGDVPGSKDHPLLTRFAGATINAYSQTAFDEAFLPNQPVDDAKAAKGLTLEGKVTRVAYTIGGNKSTLEVERNYLDALQKGGFQILFRCTQDQCGQGNGLEFQRFVIISDKMRKSGGGDAYFGDKHRTILAKLPRASGDAYVFLHVMDDSASNKRTLVYEEVVEVRPMQTGQVKVLDSGALQKGLAATGKVALYGI
ncbi:DUF4892 domain-containing protein [Burkholderia latens]|uniref:DUF4892 domain-containing protein n=1 Tax=Burkholderia latens TaxID=488446 RepID=UPI001FC7EE8C|nr:DUF4892 domain-containing protein [Burkholderia latens]